MSYQQYEKLLGETFFEANLKAENKYGKGNFEVLTSKRVKQPIYLGFGTRELVELTIGILDRKTTTRALADAPSRPLPSIELSSPKTVFLNASNSEKPALRNAGTTTAFSTPANATKATPDKKPTTPYIPGIQAYASQKSVHNREVHGLRTIQEGNNEPLPQHINAPGLEPHQIQDILTEIMAVKDERQRREKILPKVEERNRSRNNQAENNAESPADVKTMVSAMEERVNQIFALLKNLNKESGEALELKVPDLPKGLFEVKKNLLAM
ncbi:MAG: hypothetical protein KKB51_02235, partial [Candidatus Riflebacteria bacterium]|nr:hypothetical protein [Candidatus Riflebacteria bacterium]